MLEKWKVTVVPRVENRIEIIWESTYSLYPDIHFCFISWLKTEYKVGKKKRKRIVYKEKSFCRRESCLIIHLF